MSLVPNYENSSSSDEESEPSDELVTIQYFYC